MRTLYDHVRARMSEVELLVSERNLNFADPEDLETVSEMIDDAISEFLPQIEDLLGDHEHLFVEGDESLFEVALSPTGDFKVTMHQVLLDLLSKVPVKAKMEN